jgi:hypothetical protein
VVFESALANPTPIALFNSLFAFVCAPGSVLGGYFDRRANAVVFDSPDDTVNAALRRILKGQESKALKSLCSNGVAVINSATVSAIKKLHPSRVGELKLPSSQVEQLCVDEKDIADKLFVEAKTSLAGRAGYFFPGVGRLEVFSLLWFVLCVCSSIDLICSLLFVPCCSVLDFSPLCINSTNRSSSSLRTVEWSQN